MEFRADQCFSLQSEPMTYDSEKDMEPCRETLASQCSDPEGGFSSPGEHSQTHVTPLHVDRTFRLSCLLHLSPHFSGHSGNRVVPFQGQECLDMEK